MSPNTDPFPAADDASLVTALRNGDYSAFELIYRAEFSGLHRYASSIVSQDDAVDVVQDVFSSIWNNRNELPVQSVQELRYYLFRAVRNRAYKINRHDEVRNRHNEEIAYNTDVSGSLEYDSPREEDDSFMDSSSDLKERVRKLILNLPLRSREILTLRWYHNLPFDQIAIIMGISYSYTHVLHSRALGMVRKQLGLK